MGLLHLDSGTGSIGAYECMREGVWARGYSDFVGDVPPAQNSYTYLGVIFPKICTHIQGFFLRFCHKNSRKLENLQPPEKFEN